MKKIKFLACEGFTDSLVGNVYAKLHLYISNLWIFWLVFWFPSAAWEPIPACVAGRCKATCYTSQGTKHRLRDSDTGCSASRQHSHAAHGNEIKFLACEGFTDSLVGNVYTKLHFYISNLWIFWLVFSFPYAAFFLVPKRRLGTHPGLRCRPLQSHMLHK